MTRHLDLARPLSDEAVLPFISDEAMAATALRTAFANKKATHSTESLQDTKTNAAAIHDWLTKSHDADDTALDYAARVEALEMVINDGGSYGIFGSDGKYERPPGDVLAMSAAELHRCIVSRDWR
ncbi:hypothetical protein AB0F17_34735 [Nonomuraea sp. NPDC026600]|uniref:hypothetical protein n=1 Tax=Nonomuraea sp. NPDC026600 TaxID=3155363 RepID=UPI0033CE6DCA